MVAQRQHGGGVADGGVDLEPVADDAGVGHQPGAVAVVERRDHLGVEPGEGGPEAPRACAGWSARTGRTGTPRGSAARTAPARRGRPHPTRCRGRRGSRACSRPRRSAPARRRRPGRRSPAARRRASASASMASRARPNIHRFTGSAALASRRPTVGGRRTSSSVQCSAAPAPPTPGSTDASPAVEQPADLPQPEPRPALPGQLPRGDHHDVGEAQRANAGQAGEAPPDPGRPVIQPHRRRAASSARSRSSRSRPARAAPAWRGWCARG